MVKNSQSLRKRKSKKTKSQQKIKNNNPGASGIKSQSEENGSLENNLSHTKNKHQLAEMKSTAVESIADVRPEEFPEPIFNAHNEVNIYNTELQTASNKNGVHQNSALETVTSNNKTIALKWRDEWHASNDRQSSSKRNESFTTIEPPWTGFGKIFDQTREQFIDGEWKNGCLIKLHYAQFKFEKSDYIRVYALDNLYVSTKNNYVARIKLHPLNIHCSSFQNMRKQIESKIEIIKVLDDDLQNKLETSREHFKSVLISKQNAVVFSRVAQRDMFQLFLVNSEKSKIYKQESENENIALLREMLKNKLLSQEFLNEIRVIYEVEIKYYERKGFVSMLKRILKNFSWSTIIFECVQNSIASLRAVLVNALPTRVLLPLAAADIAKLPDHQLFTCSVQDIQLFSDLELSIRQHVKTSELVVTEFHDFTQDYVNKLWKLLMSRVNKCLLRNIPDDSVHTNAVFLQLFKTFLELLNLVCGTRNEDILKVVAINSNVDLRITECTESTPEKYENRLNFVMSLMNHYKPGDVKNSAFKYQFFFFKGNKTIFSRITDIIAHVFDTSLSGIPNEFVIWLYYIHYSFADLFYQEQEENISELYSFLNSLMELFITAVKNDVVSLEKIRILANIIIKFGTTISPYFLEQMFINENDLTLLLQQAEYLKSFVTTSDQTVDDITNIVDIYQVFWDERRTLLMKLRRKYSMCSTAVDELIGKFNAFIRYVFDLKIYNTKFLSLLRSFNEFMRLLHGTEFPWYVEKQNIKSETFVNLVDDSTTSYVVEDTQNFIQEYLNSGKTLPRHFLFDLAINLINCVEEFLKQSEWEMSDKIHAASDLLLLMGRSIINFNKLPNAVDFQHFFAIFTDPFKRVKQNSTDVYDFKRRLGSLENYYKYTMELNVMSVDKALELCKQNIISTSLIDYTFDFEQLNLCYEVYLDKFKNYVDKYILQPDFNVSQFAKKISLKAKPLDISQWNKKYKTLKVPKLLAGLSAVWSALESKDVISQRQVIKPHCIQILCVLRLLGVDQARCGVDSHLAQVLTGQGKSIVLSLLAAILALTGNRARIVCYNEYLAERDRNEFQLFYRTLGIADQITYGTFRNMANEVLHFNIKERRYDLRTFVHELVTGELSQQHATEAEDRNEVTNTVLLVDEVDVFFTPEFYGNVYGPCATIHSETLANLQLKIWNLTENCDNLSKMKEIMYKYIDDVFLQSDDDVFVKIVRNSKTILSLHTEEMISAANNVRKSSPGDNYSRKFKLHNDGFIYFVENNGKHTENTFNGYNNVFMYFKLKKEHFDHKNFKNYGYLIIHCGSVSYAVLPKDYSTILGVTGTLKQLSDVEMRAVTSYNISRGSDMPTFFGSSKLRISNFTVKKTKAEWSRAILDSILSIVEEGRAVIVFFVDEHTIETVRDTFAKHLSRYSVLTGNESDLEVAACVEEAGVARRVTIATRRMGRGVDFKSNDSAVESKGGVHVVQTFWSEDVKEETQIKGRTARKDNNGSYEVILCRKHLTKAGYQASACNYDNLNEARKQRAAEKGTEIANNIKESQRKHDATMEFFKSLYKYNPNRRQEYFKKYPFVDL